MEFFTVLACIFGIISSFVLVARIICWANYTEQQAMHDYMLGIKRKFPIFWPGVTAIICWAWVITA